jgi:hypothetical protein
MVLPYAEPATGDVVSHGNLTDSRVPLTYPSMGPPRVFGAEFRREQCPDRRHLWDVLMTAGEPTAGVHEGEELQPFRMSLSCVRCGLVRHLRGLVDDTLHRGPDQLNPEPLRAGGLLAQEVRRDWAGDPDLSTWAVHDSTDGPPVGVIVWSRGRRGRRYYVGKLYGNAADEVFQAPTPTACLRRMARAAADRGGSSPA